VIFRGWLALFPRRTFIPCNGGPPTWYHRVTRPGFRPCAACRPKQSGTHTPLCTLHDFRSCWGYLWSPPLLFRRGPKQPNCPPDPVPPPDSRWQVRAFTQDQAAVKLPGVYIPPRETGLFTDLANFAESLVETALESLCLSTWRKLSAGNSATFGPSFPYGLRLPGFRFGALSWNRWGSPPQQSYPTTPLLRVRHWEGVSPYTSSYELAETCVFNKQSLEPI